MSEHGPSKPNTKVMSCNCVAAGIIRVKSGAARYQDKPSTEVPFHTLNNGAQEQDRKFGKGRRLHNERIAKGKSVGWTCTVCGTRKAA